jgi:sec-independent protein translocase protein TatA
MTTMLAIFNLGNWEILILAALGLLIFGKRLPEVGRSLGKGIVEFKKGLAGIEDEVKHPTTSSNDPSANNSASQPSGQLHGDSNQHTASKTENESSKTH